MPLRKTKSGWMWGSKGPFPTKAKALQVARAAYAHGYKGGGESEQIPAKLMQISEKSDKPVTKICALLRPA